jgi:hypothetical protein
MCKRPRSSSRLFFWGEACLIRFVPIFSGAPPLLEPERPKENGPQHGGELGPSFIGCYGGITSGRSSPSDPDNIGSRPTVLISHRGCPNWESTQRRTNAVTLL